MNKNTLLHKIHGNFLWFNITQYSECVSIYPNKCSFTLNAVMLHFQTAWNQKSSCLLSYSCYFIFKSSVLVREAEWSRLQRLLAVKNYSLCLSLVFVFWKLRFNSRYTVRKVSTKLQTRNSDWIYPFSLVPINVKDRLLD